MVDNVQDFALKDVLDVISLSVEVGQPRVDPAIHELLCHHVRLRRVRFCLVQSLHFADHNCKLSLDRIRQHKYLNFLLLALVHNEVRDVHRPERVVLVVDFAFVLGKFYHVLLVHLNLAGETEAAVEFVRHVLVRVFYQLDAPDFYAFVHGQI